MAGIGRGIKCTDHLGNEFNSITERNKYWGVSNYLAKIREKKGCSLQEIQEPKEKCTDHLGNEFESRGQMYNYYNITDKLFKQRKSRGWTLEKILTTPVNDQSAILLFDIIYNTQFSFNELSSLYEIKQDIMYDRYIKNNPFVRIVGVSFLIPSHHIKINKSKYNLTVSKRIKPGKDVFECYIYNEDGTQTFKIMTYEMIDQYCIDQYKMLHNIE